MIASSSNTTSLDLVGDVFAVGGVSSHVLSMQVQDNIKLLDVHFCECKLFYEIKN
jgi:hypothetical protein